MLINKTVTFDISTVTSINKILKSTDDYKSFSEFVREAVETKLHDEKWLK